MMGAGPRNRPFSAPPVFWMLALTLACLLPFVGKAFHIDDPLFLWSGKQIQKAPGNFYGFSLNWSGTVTPMAVSFKNPPLACFYVALAAWLGGWSEPAMHFAFLLPALAAAWGAFALARHYCARPVLAAVAAILTPVFLISATTVMCDVMLLAFWVWALAFFERGLEEKRAWPFAAAGVLAGLAVLTKFPGLALVPLLAAIGFDRLRKPGWWLLAPAIPVLVAAGYELIARKLYGHGVFSLAADYASSNRSRGGGLFDRAVLGVLFMGGCFLPVLFYAPLLWRPRELFAGVSVVAIGAGMALPYIRPLENLLNPSAGLNWPLLFQCVVLVVAGAHVLILAGMDYWTRRDARSLALLFWVGGVFAFAALLNWTLNGRSLLALCPAIGLLVARRIEQRNAASRTQAQTISWPRLFWPAIPAALVSLWLAKADFDLAAMGRDAARQVCSEYLRPGKTLWFQGHWGFQYYMEKLGAKPMDVLAPAIEAGDTLVLPDGDNNTCLYDVPGGDFRLTQLLELPHRGRLKTMSIPAGAGFYAAAWAPLPFSAAPAAPLRFYVFECVEAYHGSKPKRGGLFSDGAVARQEYIAGQIARARQELQSADADGHFQLGLLLAESAQFSQAETEFNEVLRLRPGDAPAREQMAALAGRQTRMADAAKPPP